MKKIVYINHTFLEGNDAKVSALDLGLLRGFGVTDYLRTYSRIPFHITAHIHRFFDAINEVGLICDHSPQEIEEVILALIEKIPDSEVGVKLILTGGVGEDQFFPQKTTTFFAVAFPFFSDATIDLSRGIDVVTREYQRPESHIKSLSYFPSILALMRLKKELRPGEVVDILFCDQQGYFLEGATSNFFALINGEFITPSTNILKGITRNIVCSLSSAKERMIHSDELHRIKGAFFTSSNKEIVPIRQINGVPLFEGKIHPAICKIQDDFQAYIREYVETHVTIHS